jgi:hypothetical protein
MVIDIQLTNTKLDRGELLRATPNISTVDVFRCDIKKVTAEFSNLYFLTSTLHALLLLDSCR